MKSFGVDMGFTIESVICVRVRAPGPDYWRGFIERDDAVPATGGFQFSPPWRTVYTREVESAFVRVWLTE